MARKKRNYKKEYRATHGTKAGKRKRAIRNRDRRKAVRKGRVRKGDGKEVHHSPPLSKGSLKRKRKTSVVSKKKNRSMQPKRKKRTRRKKR